MAAYLRPRRGTASGSTVVLKEGEIFLDTAKSSSATTLSSWGQIYVGNNTNNINALKPFVSLPEDMVVNSGISSSGSDSDIANGKNLKTMFSAIKKLLSDHATSITTLNNDKRSLTNNTFDDIIIRDETTSYKTTIRSFETHTANREIRLPDWGGSAVLGHWFTDADGNTHTLIRVAWTNWGTTITLKGFNSTCCGILIVTDSLYTIRRTGANYGTVSYVKVYGSISVSMTQTNTNCTFTSPQSACMAAFWISNTDPVTVPN